MAGEALFQRDCITALRKLGAWVVKYPAGPHGSIGTPDLLACYRGHFLGLEIKNPSSPPSKQVPTAMQARQLIAISEAGGTARVLHSRAELDALLDEIQEIAGIIREHELHPTETDEYGDLLGEIGGTLPA